MAFMTWLLADFFVVRQIRQCTRHAHNAVEAAGGKGEFLPAGRPMLPALLFECAGGRIELTDTQGGIHFALPGVLFVSSGDNAFQNGRAAFPRFPLHQFGGGQARDFDGQIDAVKQRAGNFAAVTRDAFACSGRV